MSLIAQWLDSEAVIERATRALCDEEWWEDDWMTAMNVVGMVLEAVKAGPDPTQGVVVLSEEELHCLICAMAGNFPDRFGPIRMDLLRKLAKARAATGGQ